jgi:hypothetical protein
MATGSEKHHPDHSHKHGPNCDTPRYAMMAISTIFTMATSTTCIRITSTNMSLRSTPRIPSAVHLRPAARTSTTQIVDTKQYRMVIMSIIS